MLKLRACTTVSDTLVFRCCVGVKQLPSLRVCVCQNSLVTRVTSSAPGVHNDSTTSVERLIPDQLVPLKCQSKISWL